MKGLETPGGNLYQIVAGECLAARAVEVSDDERGELLYAVIVEARNARVLPTCTGRTLCSAVKWPPTTHRRIAKSDRSL
jgi:hypothetical protein